MKKILFLSYNYPYGLFGPSTLCTLRIMDELCQNKKYEVHNISLAKNDEPTYRVLKDVRLHYLPYAKEEKHNNKKSVYLNALLTLPIYPFTHPVKNHRFYKECIKLITGQHYDLVIAQCFPEECVWAGTKLKEDGIVDKLMVIFWDNIYGRIPRRIIPKGFALRKQRKAESWIASNADLLVSLYPIKDFHHQYGDVPEAAGKRVYLGIPSISRPRQLPSSAYQHVLKEGMINILYSGTIFRKEYVSYILSLLNKSNQAEQINLIFFSKGVPEEDFTDMRQRFKGNIEHRGWIPIYELLALYPSIDFFMSFPGYPTAIRSKVYEYMSYGKPLLLLYENDNDVNISTFMNYPVCLALDLRKPEWENVVKMDSYLEKYYGEKIPFEVVERLFQDDTARAYVNLISKVVDEKSTNHNKIIGV